MLRKSLLFYIILELARAAYDVYDLVIQRRVACPHRWCELCQSHRLWSVLTIWTNEGGVVLDRGQDLFGSIQDTNEVVIDAVAATGSGSVCADPPSKKKMTYSSNAAHAAQVKFRNSLAIFGESIPMSP
jgi:hypothetical protein